MTYRTLDANGDRFVHRCLVCDAGLASDRVDADDVVPDAAVAAALVPYPEALAMGFGFAEDLPAPEEGGGCGSCSCGRRGGTA